MRPALVALSAVAGLGAATPNVTLFKRTHASCAASRDGTFVRDRLGMTVTSNSSYSCAGDECADRVVATTRQHGGRVVAGRRASKRLGVRACRQGLHFGRGVSNASTSGFRRHALTWRYSSEGLVMLGA